MRKQDEELSVGLCSAARSSADCVLLNGYLSFTKLHKDLRKKTVSLKSAEKRPALITPAGDDRPESVDISLY